MKTTNAGKRFLLATVSMTAISFAGTASAVSGNLPGAACHLDAAAGYPSTAGGFILNLDEGGGDVMCPILRQSNISGTGGLADAEVTVYTPSSGDPITCYVVATQAVSAGAVYDYAADDTGASSGDVVIDFGSNLSSSVAGGWFFILCELGAVNQRVYGYKWTEN